MIGGAMEGDVYGNMMFENPGFGNNWIHLELEGTTSNRSAIGARIEIQVVFPDGNKKSFFHRVGSGGSFGANSLLVEAGIANASKIDYIIIKWPDTLSDPQMIDNLEINNAYHIKQNETPAPMQRKYTSFRILEHSSH